MAKYRKFTPKNRLVLLELLKKGVPIGVACDKIGVHRTTYYEWKKRAENYNEYDEDTVEDKVFAKFFEKINDARADAFMALMEEISRMGMGYNVDETVVEYKEVGGEIEGDKKIRRITKTVRHPASLIFLAERLFPATFGNKMKLDIEGIDELILRELIRLAGSSESGTAGGAQTKDIEGQADGLAEVEPIGEPEDWEDLPSE